jgi:hypothetical protein
MICLLPYLVSGIACDISDPSAVFAFLMIETPDQDSAEYHVPLTFNPIPAGTADLILLLLHYVANPTVRPFAQRCQVHSILSSLLHSFRPRHNVE